jgi:hypothetical protein
VTVGILLYSKSVVFIKCSNVASPLDAEILNHKADRGQSDEGEAAEMFELRLHGSFKLESEMKQ